ncbi:MAG: hypothetical protein OXI87_07340 [Albidovulum sp.]|nr:hypothetical protein [Albidovulum sp.]
MNSGLPSFSRDNQLVHRRKRFLAQSGRTLLAGFAGNQLQHGVHNTTLQLQAFTPNSID